MRFSPFAVVLSVWTTACDRAPPTTTSTFDPVPFDPDEDPEEHDVDRDGDGWSRADGDCDTLDPEVHPGAPEGCDGRDTDCDGAPAADELDGDGDRVPICAGDCDDSDDTLFPGAPELCDGTDNDCDGSPGPDELVDGDGDGQTVCDGDCDDTDPTTFVGAPDTLCDGVNSDCGLDPERAVPSVYPTIQGAIDAAVDGDTVCVDAGTYPEWINLVGKAIRVLGLGGPAETTIDGSGFGSVVLFLSGEGSDTVFEGFTVTGGTAPFHGGGIQIDASSPTLIDLVVEGNVSGFHGGGICLLQGAAPTLTRVTVRDNHAWQYGGGIALFSSSSAVITDSVVSGNSTDDTWGDGGGISVYTGASLVLVDVSITDNVITGLFANGGGIALSDATATLTRVEVSGNSAGSSGGGIRFEESTVATLTDVVVTGNDAAFAGGGVSLWESSPTLTNVEVSSNQAPLGGGMSMLTSELTLTNGIVSGNVAGVSGGGLYLESSSPVIAATAIVGNQAVDRSGGGIIVTNETSAPQLTNVIVSGNTSFEGGGGIDVPMGTLSISHSDVWGNTPADWGAVIAPSGTLSVDPEFLGFVGVDPTAWDLHLVADSPLVDAGDPAYADVDGSPSDVGPYGGPDGASWDRDGDGWPEWWQPGPYDASYAALGWDCDDDDDDLFPGSGC